MGCDAWVLRFSSQDPVSYAHTWLAQTEHTSDGFSSALDRWLNFYLEHHIEAVATGAIILHRTADGSEHTWTDEMPLSPSGSGPAASPAASSRFSAVRRAVANQPF